MPFFYMDYWYLILVVPTIIIAIIAQNKVTTTFRKYSKQKSTMGFTAAEVTRRILDSNGLYNVAIERVSGNLTDHYDP
ncbi:MAG: zinc metallopeptidase, partial [Oscillospiraceae bacterium]|nr:zinc metallopeptidase [Oscillospiraceae bacterium]